MQVGCICRRSRSSPPSLSPPVHPWPPTNTSPPTTTCCLRVLLTDNALNLYTDDCAIVSDACRLPPEWTGRWFLNEQNQPLTITQTSISFKGECVASNDAGFHLFRLETYAAHISFTTMTRRRRVERPLSAGVCGEGKANYLGAFAYSARNRTSGPDRLGGEEGETRGWEKRREKRREGGFL